VYSVLLGAITVPLGFIMRFIPGWDQPSDFVSYDLHAFNDAMDAKLEACKTTHPAYHGVAAEDLAAPISPGWKQWAGGRRLPSDEEGFGVTTKSHGARMHRMSRAAAIAGGAASSRAVVAGAAPVRASGSAHALEDVGISMPSLSSDAPGGKGGSAHRIAAPAHGVAAGGSTHSLRGGTGAAAPAAPAAATAPPDTHA